MSRLHGVSAGAFADLAHGNGDRDAIAGLMRAERSKHLMLIGAVHHEAARIAPDAFHKAGLAASLQLLSAAHRARPGEVEELLIRPHVGAWAHHCLRLLRQAESMPTASIGLESHLAHLGAIALAAGIRAGIEGSATLPIRSAVVCLPGMGSGLLEGAVATSLAVFHAAGDSLRCPPNLSIAKWQSPRMLRAQHDGMSLHIELDDVDPYRDDAGLGALPRLTDPAVQEWERLLGRAWRRMVTRHRHHAEAIATALRTIVPLHDFLDGHEQSATFRTSFGGISMSLPKSSCSFALSLIHEFQHIKLGALLDLFPLHVRDGRRFYSPWRPDSRPLSGLLQGCYAFLAVAGFWAAERPYDTTGLAELNHATAASQTVQACECLLSCGGLTDMGRRFVEGMYEAAMMSFEDTTPAMRKIAETVNLRHLEQWRRRYDVAPPRFWLPTAP